MDTHPPPGNKKLAALTWLALLGLGFVLTCGVAALLSSDEDRPMVLLCGLFTVMLLAMAAAAIAVLRAGLRQTKAMREQGAEHGRGPIPLEVALQNLEALIHIFFR